MKVVRSSFWDELFSRKHLQIRFDPDRNTYLALDMKSANGVIVNGRKLQNETELADDDEIEVGKTKLLFTAQEFKDRESAINHYHRRGERGKSTLVGFPTS